MNILLAPAEIGIIVKALENTYPEDSLENEILACQLINSVKDYFDKCGHAYMFELWLQEFDIQTPFFE